MLYISEVELKNFRCFEDITIEADIDSESAPWTLLTGDNASGKTTLLKAIALGLCDKSSAAGLLRESDNGYIRQGQDSGTITIRLVDRIGSESKNKYQIKTVLTRLSPRLETLEQETDPPEDFPWEQVFVCGYGAGRGTSGTGDIAGYSAISAVYNMFNYTEGLQNPELTIRRMPPGSTRQRNLLYTLERILDLRGLRLAENGSRDMGISVRDPRGMDTAFRDLADGYKSTFLWVTDFLGWTLASGIKPDAPISGVVVIDEIEQHLHPKWQKRVIETLRSVWPQVQFFASTHSPLVARNFHPLDDKRPHRHYHLRDTEDKDKVEAVQVSGLAGQRTDQVLASQAFDYELDIDPSVSQLLAELSFLANSEFLSDEQRERANKLLEIVEKVDAMRTGQTAPERSAARWADMEQRALVEALEEE